MIDQSRHVALRPTPWASNEVSAAIDEIISDALAQFDPERFWPAHPLDDVKDGHCSVYMGAAGMIWALDYLSRVGATKTRFNFGPSLAHLLEKTKAEMPDYDDYSDLGALLFGDLGTALVIMRLSPSTAVADIVEMRARVNTRLPVRELMWGMPGSMLACIAMDGEPRWRSIFEMQAERLLGD